MERRTDYVTSYGAFDVKKITTVSSHGGEHVLYGIYATGDTVLTPIYSVRYMPTREQVKNMIAHWLANEPKLEADLLAQADVLPKDADRVEEAKANVRATVAQRKARAELIARNFQSLE